MSKTLEQLVEEAKAGDSDAFGLIYDEFADPLFRFILMKVKTKHDAEDILQDTFVKAWKGLEGLNVKEMNFKAWLYTIANHNILDAHRKKVRRPETVELLEDIDLPTTSTPFTEQMTQSDISYLNELLGQLSSQYRQVLELRFVQELSIKETASVMGKSSISVRLLQYRALLKLKTLTKDNHVFNT